MSPPQPPPDPRLPAVAPAVLSLAGRELKRFARQPSRVVASVGTPLLIWVLLASGFAGSLGGGYGKHLLPGVVGLTVVFSAIFGAISLIDDRNAGFLQGVLVSPLPRWGLALAKVLGTGAIALAQGVILLPAAAVLGLDPGVGEYVLALAAIVMLVLMVNGVAMALAWRVNSVPGFHGVMNLILMPMWLLSGSFFPVAGAAPWLRAVMRANPMTWSTEALRQALQPGDTFAPAGVVWGVAVALALAGVGAASAVVGRR